MKEETTTITSQFPLVNKILTLLGLTDIAKFDRFFVKEIKRFKTEIKKCEGNKSQLALTYETDREVLEEQIEDAVDNLENARTAITIEDLQSNESTDAFRVRYWNGINRRQGELKSLKQNMEDLTETYEDEIKAIDVDIADLNKTIKSITKK